MFQNPIAVTAISGLGYLALATPVGRGVSAPIRGLQVEPEVGLAQLGLVQQLVVLLVKLRVLRLELASPVPSLFLVGCIFLILLDL